MSYTPFLIAQYATGVDRHLQPWLIPKDALVELLDGYVYRGVMNKRDGYSGYATGESSIYCESRMVHAMAIAAPTTGAIDGNNKTFTFAVIAPNLPIRRGTFVITGSNPVQVMTDNGIGAFTGAGTGTIDYTTGAVSITFTAAPVGGSTVKVTYDVHQGLPVMGIMSFYPSNNVRQMVVADRKYVNRYNPATDRLDDISPTVLLNCTDSDFFSWVNYASPAYAPRLLFCNGVAGDVIQVYDGATVAPWVPTFATGTLNARQMFQVRDRLILLQTTEAGVLYPRRIRISGTGANCDSFDAPAAGAGFIDIPDDTWFFGATLNGNDLLFFTGAGTWQLTYTGNDVAPFRLDRIDTSRGSGAAFSVTSYLGTAFAFSPQGAIVCDGSKVSRLDPKIPDFTFESIDGGNFNKCFSGFIDEDRDVYTIYPSQGVIKPTAAPANSSDRILVTNYEELNFAVYRLPLSCMGNFQESETKTWSDLTALYGFPSWDALAASYNNWNAFPFSQGSPIAIGGGHHGEIWSLNTTQGEDNPQVVRGITITNPGISPSILQVTSDWNNYSQGDTVSFTGISGLTGLDDREGTLQAIPASHTVFNVTIQGLVTGALVGAPIVSRSIPFEALSAKLNPWAESDKKIRCGWIYFYISTADTVLKDGNGDVPALLDIELITNDMGSGTTTATKYQVNCSDMTAENGTKKWAKIWINQTARFLQFRLSNSQAGAKIQVHAMMPGLQPIGRLV